MKHIRIALPIWLAVFATAGVQADHAAAYAYTQAMFGHLGVIEVDCGYPEDFVHFEDTMSYCGEFSSDFSLFQQRWDIYADWVGEVPVIPTPVTAWQKSESYVRKYMLEDESYEVHFSEFEGSPASVWIGVGFEGILDE